jgi:hypothetical protein
MELPTKIQELPDFLFHLMRTGEAMWQEDDRRALCLRVESMDFQHLILTHDLVRELVRRAVRDVAWYLREENIHRATAQHLATMAIVRIKMEMPQEIKIRWEASKFSRLNFPV